MSCEHDCPKPPVFPRTIFNRPALSQIDYRIGAYAEMRSHMFDALNQAPALNGWTHRGPDDPGIALIESSAIVGDILTFYQSLYANEAYLRSAQWRESIAELVRLLGYRLAPGLGGEAVFALAVKGNAPVTVPKGFGFKAQVESDTKPAEFESREEAVAHPHLSEFRLYKPYQNPGPNLSAGMQEFALSLPGGGRPAISLRENDRLLIGAPQPTATNPTRLANAEIVLVEETREEFGELIVRIKGRVMRNLGAASVVAFKLGESLRHFGHNAPAQTYRLTSGSSPTLSTSSVNYERFLLTAVVRSWLGEAPYEEIDPAIARLELPLDAETETFGAGDTVLIETALQGYEWGGPIGTSQRYILIGRVAALANRSLTLGGLLGSGSVLTLEEDMLFLAGLDPSVTILAAGMDIRQVNIHSVQSGPLRLHSKPAYVSAASGVALAYFGTAEQVNALMDRELLLVRVDGMTMPAYVVALAADALDQPDVVRHRTLSLDISVNYPDFLHADPNVTVYGNPLYTTQGKTQAEVILGSGDQRQVFQTFALPKAPLTYLLDETQTPAQAPELHVYVNGIEWRRVDTFYNSQPDDRVYIVREDEDNKSYVQFGDNKTGSRLPSGINNVSAVYRVGQGAYGVLKPGTNPQPADKLKDLNKVFLHASVAGGSAPEGGDNARAAAPGKMQSLGRLVSLADFEAETLAIPNVIKARAVWSAPEGTALVRVIVLTESGESADTAAVQASLTTFNRCRGPARFPIQVTQGIRQFVHLNVTAGFEATRRQQDIEVAIKEALGLAGEEGNGILGEDGLFSLKHCQFGEAVHKSQIIAAVQQVPGVTWVSLNAAQSINLGITPATDPTTLAIPAPSVVNDVLACTEERLLALYSTHFVLSLSQDQTTGVCA